MQDLAQTIVKLADIHGTVPVIVVPKSLRLKPAFYVNLVQSLRDELDSDQTRSTLRRIRIDCLREPGGLACTLVNTADRFHLQRLNRILGRNGSDAEAMMTTILSRPAGTRRTLVIGTASETAKLPTWAAEISIGTAPIVDLASVALPNVA